MYVFSDDEMLAITGFSRVRANLLDGEFTSIINLINNSPSVSFGYYDVRSYGITMNSTAAGAANTTAFQALLDTIKNSGIRGSIKIPDGKLYLNSRIGVGDPNLAAVRFQGHSNIRIWGNGESSQIVWQGDLQSTSKHLFWLSGGYVGALGAGITRVTTKGVTFENLWIGIGDITHRDLGGEQNHLIRVYTDQRGDVENIRIVNCTFGLTGGDAVFLGGDGGAQNGGQVSWAQDISIRGCRFDGYQHEAVAPPGYGYRTCISQQRNTRDVAIIGNYFTGSDDALIDMEATGGTTPSGNDDILIQNNRFVVSAPSGVATAAVQCIQISGNGEVDGDFAQAVHFEGNTIRGGRIFGIRWWRVNIKNNHIYADTGIQNAVGLIEVEDRMDAVDISGNTIYVPSGFTGNNILQINHETYTAGQRAHVAFNDNHVEYTDLGGTVAFQVESVDFSARGNKINYRGAGAASGIVFNASAVSNDMIVTVNHNTIVGDLGGGSLQYGVQMGPNTKQMICEVSGNVGAGIATAGVRFGAPSGGGAYAQIPIAIGNAMPGGVLHGSGGAAGHWMVAGNAGGVTMTVGNNGSPEGAVTAVQGSEHVRRNGDSTTKWDKTTGTGNTGWVQRTIP